MSNLRKDLEEMERLYGEPIEAMVVGKHDKHRWDDEPSPSDENTVISRADGLARVDEEYNSGFGSADCYPLYAWTASRVFFVQEYDGATGVSWVPRNPIAIDVQFSGQSPSMDYSVAKWT